MADEEVLALEGQGGLRLSYRHRRGTGAVGALLFIHGLGDHSGWFDSLATAASAAGLEWFGLDLRGHGASEGKRGHADSFVTLLEDVDRLRRRVVGTEPAVLGGHSLGGLVTLRYAQTRGEGLAGILLVAPFLALAARVPAWKRAAGRWANTFLPSLTLDNGLRHEELISDPEALEAHEGDPLSHRRISARLWSEILAAQESARRSPLRVPALLQVAGDDRAVRTDIALKLSEGWSPRSRTMVYPGAYHDLYHDRVAERAIADAIAWVTATCRERVAGASIERTGDDCEDNEMVN